MGAKNNQVHEGDAQKPRYQPPEDLEARVQATPRPVRWLLRGFACVCLVLAGIGVVLPGMPTTVFVLLAAWAAARSSPALLRWLYQHRWFGPVLYNWEHGRTVSRRAKWMAALTMLICAVVILLVVSKLWVALIPCAIMAVVLTWLWSRPEPLAVVIELPTENNDDQKGSCGSITAGKLPVQPQVNVDTESSHR